ncbi:MAG: NRDE family protein [Pseudomonadota bacterium]
MCLVVLAFRHHPDYPLVVVANRDEYYDRPALPAHFWEDRPHILGGRDQEAGGTWFAVDRSGRWATVTNYRGGAIGADARSRGELPVGFLDAGQPALTYVDRVLTTAHRYRGFSLLAGSAADLAYCTNQDPHARALAPGIYTLSNDVLDTPWPKAEYARRMLAAVLAEPGELGQDRLLAILGSREQFPDAHLPDTGVGLELERVLSAPFIVSDSYGTRATTVLTIRSDGELRFAEQSYHRGRATGRRDYRWRIEPAPA